MLKERSECVKVVVRCRPLSNDEMNAGHQCIVKIDNKKGVIECINPKNEKELKTFTYDKTYDWRSSQEEIFDDVAKPILESVMEGYNGTIFAYGQTGTGKSFTMMGAGHGKTELKGIIPRSIDWIFKAIENKGDQEFLVRVAFVEIYNEEIRDLLNKNIKNKLKIREKEGVFYVEDNKVIKVENANQMLQVMEAGEGNRAKGSTKMNIESSRSHSIFQIIVENSYLDESGERHYRMGKLNLVDLAGSERQTKTEATGDRLKEATKINLSLTILGNVISSLISSKKVHVPYRESKLTMLLCDSLGGNTKTVMIANIGPSDFNYDESLNTLWYAARAKKIQNKPTINEDPKDALMRQYQEEIEALRLQLAKMGKGEFLAMDGKALPGFSNGTINAKDNEKEVKQIMENLEKEKDDFRKQQEEEIQKIKQKKNLAEDEKNQLIEKLNNDLTEFKKSKDEAKRMLMKYGEMKKKVLNGSKIEKKVKEQETEIIKNKEELIKKTYEEERLKREIEDKEKDNLKLKQQYESKQANIDDLNDKINQIRNRIEEIKSENQETRNHLEMQLAGLQEFIGALQIENLKKEFILNHFIPAEEREKIQKSIEFNKKENTYSINRILAIKNNYKNNRETLNKIKKNKIDAMVNHLTSNLFKNEKETQDEQIINLRLEHPEKLTMKFDGEANENILKEIDHVLRDDDSDLVYFNNELNILDGNLTLSSLGIVDEGTKLNLTGMSSASSTSTSTSATNANSNSMNSTQQKKSGGGTGFAGYKPGATSKKQ